MDSGFKDLVAAINEIKKNLDSRTDLEFQKYLEFQRSVINCNKIQSAGSWNDVDTILDEIIKDPKAVAAGVAAMPEKLRSQLTLKSWKTDVIKNVITESQKDIHYDPYFIIPTVSTQEFVNILPASAQQCYLCGKGFEDFQKILWKYCHRHTMHYCCLRDEMNKDRLPLHGPCGCDGTAAPDKYFEARQGTKKRVG